MRKMQSYYVFPVVVVLLGTLFSSTPHLVEARCGYPELPYQAHLTNKHSNKELLSGWSFFEEGQLMKVFCENGLLGVRSVSLNQSQHIDTGNRSFLTIDSFGWIQCHNSHWNTSELICVHKLDIETHQILLNGNHAKEEPASTSSNETVNNLNTLIDNNAFSCIPILATDTETTESDNMVNEKQVMFISFDLKPDKVRIPRIVLMIKRDAEENSTLQMETLISEGQMNNNDTDLNQNDTDNIGDVEVEEAKRFLDFVYLTEFTNHSGIPKMLLLAKPNETILAEKKTIYTKTHVIHISVGVGSQHDHNTANCYLNEDAAFQMDQTNDSTELLIFDCHLKDDDAQLEDDKKNFVWLQIDIVKQEDKHHQQEKSMNNTVLPLMQLCGVEVLALSEHQCGKPYVPIYGLVTQVRSPNGQLNAEYKCVPGYQVVNLTEARENEIMINGLPKIGELTKKNSMLIRHCNDTTNKWSPAVEDIFCEPQHICRNTPPLSNPKKFYFEYSKLDYLKRAIADQSMATLRCQMFTEFVVPFTIFACNKEGNWMPLGKNDTTPTCTSIVKGRRPRPNHYYHHYYHYYQDRDHSNTNRTAIILFGRQLNDNKYLIYYGAAGLIILFGGSFIILFHVRRMAKKISCQMRERSYMATEKGMSEGFFQVDNNGPVPPYGYDNVADYYDANTLFSNDLPPPATPISMPATGLEKSDLKDKNNLSSNFDSIKF